jgi:hypothetical protein
MSDTTTTTDKVTTEIAVLASRQTVTSEDVNSALATIVSDQLSAGATSATTPPTPTTISEAEREALSRLPEVFGRVAPEAPAPLSSLEADALLVERTLLGTIEKLVKTRKDDIRAIVNNALDAALAESGEVDDDTPRDAHGWCLVPGEVAGDTEGRFVRTVRRGSVSVDLDRLQQLADDPECNLLTHEDWLALTRQTRVFDEAKAALALRDNPELLRALAEATVTTGANTVVTQKKR